jgi:RNA polymerase sigma-70 factor (ECF subfamily)
VDADIELLNAWRGGDRIAGNRLFERYFQQLYRFFWNKVSAPEDLVQQTLMACLEDQFRGESSFRTYVFQIAKNRLISHLRRARSAPAELDIAAHSVADLGDSPSFDIARRQEQTLLIRSLRRVPLESQLILELHYWEKLSGPEIAAIVDIPLGTVRSRLRRARELLQQQIEALATSPELSASTIGGLDTWAEALRCYGAVERKARRGTPR